MDRHPAPPPNPYPLGPYFRPWQFLQNSTDSCSLQFVESRALLHMPGGGDENYGYCGLLLRFSIKSKTLTALEAGLVEFVSTSDALLSGVHRLGALGALGGLNGGERHLGLCKCKEGGVVVNTIQSGLKNI